MYSRIKKGVHRTPFLLSVPDFNLRIREHYSLSDWSISLSDWSIRSS